LKYNASPLFQAFSIPKLSREVLKLFKKRNLLTLIKITYVIMMMYGGPFMLLKSVASTFMEADLIAIH